MNKKSEKIIKTIAPAVTGTIILVGKAAGKMKEELNRKLPGTKVISACNEIEDRKDRKIVKRDLVKRLAVISIPVIATGIGLIIRSFKELDESKKINDEINNIDTLCKLEDMDNCINGSAKDRTENIKKASVMKTEIALNIAQEIIIVSKHKSISIDKDELIYALSGCIDLKDNGRLIKLITSYKDIKIANDLISIYNSVINRYGIKQIKYMLLTDDCADTIINSLLSENIVSIISKELEPNGSTIGINIDKTELSAAVIDIVSYHDHALNDSILLIKLFQDLNIDPSIQLKILIKIHGYLESIRNESV